MEQMASMIQHNELVDKSVYQLVISTTDRESGA
jgi:hypothetical protein